MRGILLIALLILVAAPATAAEDIPPPYEVRFIDRHGASSACIGDASTPLCAVETWLACKVRRDSELCSLVDRRVPRGAEWVFAERLEYRVLGVRTAGDCNNMNRPDVRDRCLDVTRVTKLRVHELAKDGPFRAMNTYWLLRDDDGWRIIDILTNGKAMQLYQSPEKGLY